MGFDEAGPWLPLDGLVGAGRTGVFVVGSRRLHPAPSTWFVASAVPWLRVRALAAEPGHNSPESFTLERPCEGRRALDVRPDDVAGRLA